MSPATTPERPGKWGIMGGIFDPVHYGHLILAESARQTCGLDGVLFVPSLDPPHRSAKPIASFEDRCTMVKLAIEGNDRFVFSDMEKSLASPGYTLAVIDYLKQTYPEPDWHLILGADNIAIFDTWHKPKELVERVKILVGQRPGNDSSLVQSAWYDLITIFPMPLIEISSTAIRERIAAKYSIRYLLPDDVRRFVETRGLYR